MFHPQACFSSPSLLYLLSHALLPWLALLFTLPFALAFNAFCLTVCLYLPCLTLYCFAFHCFACLVFCIALPFALPCRLPCVLWLLLCLILFCSAMLSLAFPCPALPRIILLGLARLCFAFFSPRNLQVTYLDRPSFTLPCLTLFGLTFSSLLWSVLSYFTLPGFALVGLAMPCSALSYVTFPYLAGRGKKVVGPSQVPYRFKNKPPPVSRSGVSRRASQPGQSGLLCHGFGTDMGLLAAVTAVGL